MRKFLFLLLIYSVIPTAHASEWAAKYETQIVLPDTQLGEFLGDDLYVDTFKCYAYLYSDPSAYKERHCHENIRNLYRACFAVSLPVFHSKKISSGNVLYILRLASDDQFQKRQAQRIKLQPLNAKSRTSEWNYHVVLEFNGYIFDMDNTAAPLALDVESYFLEMFGMTVDHISQKYVVREIPAEIYFQEYTESGTGDKDAWYWINDRDSRFPMEHLSGYLNRRSLLPR